MDPSKMTLAQFMGMMGVMYNGRELDDDRTKIQYIADHIESTWIPAQEVTA